MSVAMDQRPIQQRTRSKSTFSFKSDKSHDSHNKKQHQTHQRTPSKEVEKQHLHASTKADPNAAMNEVQPIATALEKPTLQSLRSFQHTDSHGQPIAEPDLSNPTRSRWERPLDTIRAFEAAIDNEYKRRSYAMRPGSEAPGSEVMSGFASRRSSYYGGGYEQNRYSQAGGGGGYGGGYYGSRQAAAQRDSWADNGYGPGPGPGPAPGPRMRYNRMQSDPSFRGYGPGHNPYPSQQNNQQSRETVITGGSNGSHSEPYSTDPSSENSSIERGGPVGGPVMKPDIGEQYGFSGFGNGPQPILEEYSGNGAGPPNGYYPGQNVANLPPPVPSKSGPPPPPAHNPSMIKLGKTNSPTGQGPPPAGSGRPNVLSRKSSDMSDKRRSWFKRRFSKN